MSSSSSKPSGKNPAIKSPGARKSLQSIQDDFDSVKAGDVNDGNRHLVLPLENLMTAWAGIQALSPEDPTDLTNLDSFWSLAATHGQPFRGAGWSSSAYWGGYCHHGNVLFPLWHRVYLLKLDEALGKILNDDTFLLPYWDEMSTRDPVIPTCLTDEKFTYKTIQQPPKPQVLERNPLASYKFQFPVTDFVNGRDINYSKHKDYTTVRYPLSGLVGTAADRKITDAHNDKFAHHAIRVAHLNGNVHDWLYDNVEIDGKPYPFGVRDKYVKCLKAPNYTVFSNVTSQNQYNSFIIKCDESYEEKLVVSIEDAHDQIHLALGGFDNPKTPGTDESPIAGANGDMGENDTAAFDPIFFFHHAWADYLFWEWQQIDPEKHTVRIIPEYPGTNSVDRQGPIPGVFANDWLDLNTPLKPFIHPNPPANRGHPYYIGSDVISTDALGYTYERSPHLIEAIIEQNSRAYLLPSEFQTVEVSGINRSNIAGSFVISLFVKTKDGRDVHVGTDGVLSRWSVSSCANCQNHLETRTFFSIPKSLSGPRVAFAQNLRGEPEVEATVNLRKTKEQKQTVVKSGAFLTSPSSSGTIENKSLTFAVKFISSPVAFGSSSSS